MRIDITVRPGPGVPPGAGSGGVHDVAIVGPPPLAWRDIAAAFERTLGVAPGLPWWTPSGLVVDQSRLGAASLRTGSVLTTERPPVAASTSGVLTLHQIGGPGAGRVVALERGRIDIGRHADCELTLSDADVSRRHARLDIAASRIRLTDLGSTNGTYLNGTPIGPDGADVHTGDRIAVGAAAFEVVGPVESPAAVTWSLDGALRVVRAPRVVPPRSTSTIEMPVESSAARPRGVQWFAAVLPAAAGAGLAWAMHAPQFLLFALLSPVMMLSSSIGDRLHWRRTRRRAAADFVRRRAVAVEDIAAGLQAETSERRSAAPDPAALLRTSALPGSRLWERSRPDHDFLRARIGTADRPSELEIRTGSVITSAGVVRSVPVDVELRRGPVGLCGPRPVIDGVATWMLAQLATLHSPVDVSVTFLLTPDTSRWWRWARWLPHLAGAAATSADECSTVVGQLLTIAETRRSAARAGPGGWGGPWHVLVLDPAHELADLPGLASLLDDGAAVGITAVVLSEDEAGLPASCRALVRVSGETGTRADIRCVDAASIADVVLDDVTAQWAEEVARNLAPAVDASGNGAGALPASCGLAELLDRAGSAADDDAVARRWAVDDGSARTSLGVGPDGVLRLDLVADGPHLLIAGTTGSGKSELLRTLVAGLACEHPPDRLTFLLVDYKGGAAFAECSRLPHAVGLVTDLDPQLTERALRSLHSELRRRERLFASVGAADLAEYRASAPEPVARLVIVVDEFATLAEELPDFVRGLVGVAQRGRSLGIHLVLATQRPGGAVSADIRANTTARIALRVTDPAESSDVIDVADAATIERSLPGRAYLRTGSSLTCFQAAQASGRSDRSGVPKVLPLGPWRRLVTTAPGADVPSDLARVVGTLGRVADRAGRTAGPAPWLAPLAEHVPLHSLSGGGERTSIPYAIVDLPDEQRQEELRLDLARGSALLAAGAAGSGRTGLLCTVALAAAAAFAPDELHLYVIDPGGELAAVVGDLPHCCTVLGSAHVETAPTLLRRLDQAVAAAGQQPSAGGVEPISVVLIDEWESMCAALPDADAIECGEVLASLHRRGIGNRLTIVVTGGRSALAPRFAAGFDERLLLAFRDRADYGLAGISARDVPAAMPPGRALRAADAASVQIAAAGDGPGAGPLRAAAEKVRASWLAAADRAAPISPGAGREAHRSDRPTTAAPLTGLPVRLRALPTSVALTTILDPAPIRERSSGRRDLVLGVGGETAERIAVDLFAGAGRFLVAGPPRSGRSTLLCSLLAQAAGRRDLRVLVGAPRRSPLAALAADLGVEVLDPAGRADGADILHGAPTLLLVDDGEAFVDEPVGLHLESRIRAADPALAAVVAGRAEDLATSYRGLGAAVRRANCGLLLRPGPVDGELLGVRLPRRPRAGPPGRGVLVGDPQWGPLFHTGEPVPIQVALP